MTARFSLPVQSTNVGGSAFAFGIQNLIYPADDLFEGPADQDGFVLRLEKN